MKKKIIVLICVISVAIVATASGIIYLFLADSSKSTGNSTSRPSYDPFSNVDKTQFDRFCPNTQYGLAWVFINKGEETYVGCINTSGDYIIKPTTKLNSITRSWDGGYGLAFYINAFGGGTAYIYNTKGELIQSITVYPSTKYEHLENGDMLFYTAKLKDATYNSKTKDYIFSSTTQKFSEIKQP